MVKKPVSVTLEISGPAAIWARPDTAAAPSSYPAPAKSQARGILESIAWLKRGAWFAPSHVEICRRVGTPGGVEMQPYTTSYGGPLRKLAQIKIGAGFQLAARIVTGACYRIHATVEGDSPSGGHNARHHLQDLFYRRLQKGQVYRTPSLGWSEFVADYWGPVRPNLYEVDDSINMILPAMLLSTFGDAPGSRLAPTFAQDVEIKAGVLHYAG